MSDTTDLERAILINQELLTSSIRQHELKNIAQNVIQEKDRFLAMLSHELRTPLTPALTAIQLLEKLTGLPDEAANYIKIIKRNIGLEVHLIDDLLDMTKMRYGKTKLTLSLVDINEAINLAVENCQEQLEAKGQKLTLELNASEHIIRGDANRIQQVFWNLISNAIKFTLEGTITLTTKNVENDRIEISVTDTGKGIDQAILPKIFNAFEQGDESVTKGFGGLGLGLAICKNLVELHSGKLEAQSDGLNKGSTFTLSLPTEKVDKIELEKPKTTEPTKKANHTILLVEDNVDAGVMLKMALDNDGHFVHHAVDVASAIKAAGNEKFDLLLSDMGLPDGSGLDIIPSFHKDNISGKSIAITGYGMKEDIQKTSNAGFDLHMTKPIDLDDLETAIDKLFIAADSIHELLL